MTDEPIKIEKPAKPAGYTEYIDVLRYENTNELEIINLIKKAENPHYLYWTDLKRKNWFSEQLTPERFWHILKSYRQLIRNKTEIQDIHGNAFGWVKCSHYEQLLHEIDLNMGGRLIGQPDKGNKRQQKYLSYTLIEESIASAQLEGAHTTRQQAIKMIREGRTPADRSQRMIYNNYRAMQLIESEMKDRPFSMNALLDLHKLLTTGTLDSEEQTGRLRRDDEDIVVEGEDGMIAHAPPPVAFVKKELGRFVDWANDAMAEKDFIHPVIKAVCLHFWIGYLHPFTDGNGRLARAVFYWYLLRKGYRAFAFIPISTRIKKSPKQYGWSYIYSEQDDNDLTYFIDYNLRQIEMARKDFENYVSEKIEETESVAGLARRLPHLNDRQIQLIQYLITHPKERTNVTSLVRLYGVTPATAVKDLKTLEALEFLTRERQGKNVFYYPTQKLLSVDGSK